MTTKTNKLNNSIKYIGMKQFAAISLITLALLSSCGGSKKEETAALNDKKAELEKLKSDNDKIDAKIKALETDISKLDTSAANTPKTKLVAIQTLADTDFVHYIELQGKVDAENISYISPRGQASQVKAVYVKQGQLVKKGQLLLKLDDAILQQSVVSARQGLETLRTQLNFAKDLYQRQKNLWDQGIGTEVQLVTAKNNVVSAENQIAALQENVKVSQEQLKTSLVYSDVNGFADLVNIRVGETFVGQVNGVPQIRIVNNSQLKVTANIPENYLGAVHTGSSVIVEMPDVNKKFNVALTFVGASIDIINRGFVVEAKLPTDPVLKPNQIALLKVKDYGAANTIAIPLNTLQNDEKGKFVMVASTENGKLVARKRSVNIGLLSGDLLEIKTGLKAGDVLITEGFAGLYEGQLLTLK